MELNVDVYNGYKGYLDELSVRTINKDCFNVSLPPDSFLTVKMQIVNVAHSHHTQSHIA